MHYWLWTIAIMYAIDVIQRIVWLGTGNIPARKPSVIACDLAINCAMLIWLAVVWR